MVNPELQKYIEECIILRYDTFDSAHSRSHVMTVISESMKLASYYDVDEDMVYAIAAYHDTGLCDGREYHHIVSGRILTDDSCLRQWFDEEQIAVMKEAVEDHRASNKNEPRSIYGKIVAEADRVIDLDTTLRRAVQYGLRYHPDYSEEEAFERFVGHLRRKYSENGYMHLWIPQSDNAVRLAELRKVISDDGRLHDIFSKMYAEEKSLL